MSFRYTEAIVCRLPDCLPPAENNIDLLKCRIELENFVTVLRDTGMVRNSKNLGAYLLKYLIITLNMNRQF